MTSTPSSARLLALGAAALLALAGCDKPKPHEGADQGGPLGRSGATGNPPAAPVAANTTTDALPALPAWAADYMGKSMTEGFADRTADCVGNTDLVAMRYVGTASPGVRIEGWGWNIPGKKAVARVLLADEAGKVVGAGDTGLPRPDVVRARPEVTSPTTGWQAYTAKTGGGIYAWGLTGDKAVCRLGHINL